MDATEKTPDEMAEMILAKPRTFKSSVRDVIKTLEDHSARQVPIQASLAGAIPKVAAQLMLSSSERNRAAGAKLIQAALRYNLDLFEFADKSSRLDNGMPTEVTDLYIIQPPPRARLE